MKKIWKKLIGKLKWLGERLLRAVLTAIIVVTGILFVLFEMLLGLIMLPWHLWQHYKQEREFRKSIGED